jgi:hypothetical protein
VEAHSRAATRPTFPLAGLSAADPANVAALDLGRGRRRYGPDGPFVPALPANWETLYESR